MEEILVYISVMCDNGARFRERRGAGTATCTHPVHLSRARRRSQAATTAQVTLWEEGRKMPRGAGTMRQKFISVTWAATCWHRGGRSYGWMDGWMDKQPGDLLNGEQQQWKNQKALHKNGQVSLSFLRRMMIRLDERGGSAASGSFVRASCL